MREWMSKIWNEVAGCNDFEKDTVEKQRVRWTDSMAANLSESHGGYHFAKNKKFCFYTRGSLDETRTFLDKAGKRGLIAEEKAATLSTELKTSHKRLNAYIRSIGSRVKDPRDS